MWKTPTKWFVNLTSDKMSQDSPGTKLTKTEIKYQRFNDNKQEWENTEEYEQKYENKNVLGRIL